MNNIAMNGTAHLTLVPTPSAAELERMVGMRPAPRRLSPRRRTTLRLTPRGRLVVVVLFLLTLLAGGVLSGSGVSLATNQAGPAHAYRYVTVQPGQTLWGIAKEVAPQRDPRATIEDIRRLNALSDTGVQAGQQIALP
jgi:hypothetical protein